MKKIYLFRQQMFPVTVRRLTCDTSLTASSALWMCWLQASITLTCPYVSGFVTSTFEQLEISGSDKVQHSFTVLLIYTVKPIKQSENIFSLIRLNWNWNLSLTKWFRPCVGAVWTVLRCILCSNLQWDETRTCLESTCGKLDWTALFWVNLYM